MLTDQSFVVSPATTVGWIIAWDRRRGQSVLVSRQPVVPGGSVRVVPARSGPAPDPSTAPQDAPYTALAADIDARTRFCIGYDWGWPQWRQAARRAAWDRRQFWRQAAALSDQQLERELAGHADDMRATDPDPGRKTHLRKVAATLRRHRASGIPLIPPSAAVKASDRAQLARQRASRASREQEQQWAAADIAAHARPGTRFH